MLFAQLGELVVLRCAMFQTGGLTSCTEVSGREWDRTARFRSLASM